MKKFTTSEISNKLVSLTGWKFEDNFLIKTFGFKDFNEAFGFMGRVALIAEKISHHPNWSGVNNKVTIKLNTHEVEGITDLDFSFAELVEDFFS